MRTLTLQSPLSDRFDAEAQARGFNLIGTSGSERPAFIAWMLDKLNECEAKAQALRNAFEGNPDAILCLKLTGMTDDAFWRRGTKSES